jgi:hypothetical protein
LAVGSLSIDLLPNAFFWWSRWQYGGVEIEG